jgi:hypothetical protein
MRVAASREFLVVAAPVFSLRWKRPGGTSHNLAFAAIVDVDVYRNRLLILGAQKDERERFAPDGAIAWLGSLDKGLSDLRAVHYSASGPGAKTMGACGPLDLGAVRFLGNGSFVIVPGVEPGAFLYDPAGKLVRTWDTTAIGLDDDCAGLSREQQLLLSAQPEPRYAWLNQRRLLDDVLPLPQGPGLIVRSVSQGRTRWQLKQLRRDGGIDTYDIPVPSHTALSHLHGDVRGGRIVFLLSEYGKDGPTAPARLVLAETPVEPKPARREKP